MYITWLGFYGTDIEVRYVQNPNPRVLFQYRWEMRAGEFPKIVRPGRRGARSLCRDPLASRSICG